MLSGFVGRHAVGCAARICAAGAPYGLPSRQIRWCSRGETDPCGVRCVSQPSRGSDACFARLMPCVDMQEWRQAGISYLRYANICAQVVERLGLACWACLRRACCIWSLCGVPLRRLTSAQSLTLPAPCNCAQVVRRSLKDQSKSALRDVSHMKVIEYEGGKSKAVGESCPGTVNCMPLQLFPACRRGQDRIDLKGTFGLG